MHLIRSLTVWKLCRRWDIIGQTCTGFMPSFPLIKSETEVSKVRFVKVDGRLESNFPTDEANG